MTDITIPCPYCGSDMVFKAFRRTDLPHTIEFWVGFACPKCHSRSCAVRHLVTPEEYSAHDERVEYVMEHIAAKIVRDALAKRAASE